MFLSPLPDAYFSTVEVAILFPNFRLYHHNLLQGNSGEINRRESPFKVIEIMMFLLPVPDAYFSTLVVAILFPNFRLYHHNLLQGNEAIPHFESLQ